MKDPNQDEAERAILESFNADPNRTVAGKIVERRFEGDDHAMLCFRVDNGLEILRLAENAQHPPAWRAAHFHVKNGTVRSFELVQ